MNEAFEKILNDMKNKSYERCGNDGMGGEPVVNLDDAIEIVKQAVEQQKDFDMEFAKKCVELAEKMNICDLVAENCRLSNENRFFRYLKLSDCNNGWIPCSERLPEDGTTVLIQDFEEYYEVSICETRNGVKGFSSGDWWTSANNYIAWQPLPKPFQKGE